MNFCSDKKKCAWLGICVFVAFCLSCNIASAQQKQVVKLGMSTALSGPAADLGKNMKCGVEVALGVYNKTGKFNGQLIALDDGYEPMVTAPNMRRLIFKEQVMAIVGNVGTPTAVVALPIATQQNICFYGAYTGAGILRRDPPDPQVFNYRASYVQETAEMVRGLVGQGGFKPQEIAVFTQRDAYGDAGYSGAMKALLSHGLKSANQIIHARYERNTMAVEYAVAEMLLAKRIPRAVIMVGAYGPCAKFIKLAKQSGIDAVFLNVSFVGTESLIQALGPLGEGVMITQVVPHPLSDLPIVKAYRHAMQIYAPEQTLNFGSLEGFISTTIFCQAINQIQAPVTRPKIITALNKMGTFDIGLGAGLSFDSQKHQATSQVWPTIIRNQKAVPFKWEQFSNNKLIKSGGGA